jgi:hypothetical protein
MNLDVKFNEQERTFNVGFGKEASPFSSDFGEVHTVTTSDHTRLTNLDAANQHPISAITGLEEALEGKQPSGAYLTEETDPTVPEWAKQVSKPSYTAEEVGALPKDTKIPSKTSDLTNDSGYITGFTEKDPTVPAWAKQTKKPAYTASEVGADPSGSAGAALKSAKEYTDKQIAAIPTPDVSGQISAHNTAVGTHNDIRLLVSGLTDRLNALANSDDTTLDQMAEVVAYIKDNRELIEQVTTGKVSVSDIIDNLTTNVANKPLRAAQGVALKGLIDAIVVPTNVSAFENDAGYLTEHQDLSDYAKRSDIPTFESEVWTFELEDGSTVTKTVVIG